MTFGEQLRQEIKCPHGKNTIPTSLDMHILNYKELSVFGLERRTNNDCESYHANFNFLVEKAHPGAYDFAQFCNQMFFNQQMEFERLQANPHIPVVRERRGDLEYRNARLKELERMLINGQINAMEFIDKNSHSVDGVIDRILEDDVSDDENDFIHEDQDIIRPNNAINNQDSCLSCNQPITGDKFFLECGQQPFCNDCSERIVLENICNICNRNVSLRLPIRQ